MTHRVRARTLYLLGRNGYVLDDVVSVVPSASSHAHRRSRRADLPYTGVYRLAGTNACEGPSMRGRFARRVDLQGFAPGGGGEPDDHPTSHSRLVWPFQYSRPKPSALILIMRAFIVLRLTIRPRTEYQSMRLARYSALRLREYALRPHLVPTAPAYLPGPREA